MSRFYFCHSPLITFRDGIVSCIYGSTKPRFLAMVEKLGQGAPVSALNYVGSNIVFSYGLDDGEVCHYLLAVHDNIDGVHYTKLLPVLRKAVKWYIQARGKETSARSARFDFLQDYNPTVPGLQLMHLVQTDQYLLSYGVGVKGFTGMDEVQDFMESRLKLPASVLESKGMVNTDRMG